MCVCENGRAYFEVEEIEKLVLTSSFTQIFFLKPVEWWWEEVCTVFGRPG